MIREVRIPSVENENGKKVPLSKFKEGFLLRVTLNSPLNLNTSKTIFFGIYQGIDYSELGIK